jgi:hypothetical protein
MHSFLIPERIEGKELEYNEEEEEEKEEEEDDDDDDDDDGDNYKVAKRKYDLSCGKCVANAFRMTSGPGGNFFGTIVKKVHSQTPTGSRRELCI